MSQYGKPGLGEKKQDASEATGGATGNTNTGQAPKIPTSMEFSLALMSHRSELNRLLEASQIIPKSMEFSKEEVEELRKALITLLDEKITQQPREHLPHSLTDFQIGLLTPQLILAANKSEEEEDSPTLFTQKQIVRTLLKALVKSFDDIQDLANKIGTSAISIYEWMIGLSLPQEKEYKYLWAAYLAQEHNAVETPAETVIPIQILEEPLSPTTLTTATSALTGLATKAWLIAQGRYADLIQYTQTHDERFVREAGVTIR